MKSIHLVDDDPDQLALLETVLRERFEVSCFPGGEQALAAWRNTAPDLVLLDVSMPPPDGLAVLACIRADERLCEMPVIAFSAHASARDRARFLDAGFTEHVTKPILDFDELCATVARLAG